MFFWEVQNKSYRKKALAKLKSAVQYLFATSDNFLLGLRTFKYERGIVHFIAKFTNITAIGFVPSGSAFIFSGNEQVSVHDENINYLSLLLLLLQV